MNNPLTRKISAVVVSVLILFLAYYGNFLPMVKSQTLISTMQNLRSINSVSQLSSAFAASFNIPSPIGQEESVRSSGNVVLGVIQQTDRPDVISDLMNFMETSYRPIVEYGRGMSFEQNLYILGTLNELSFVKTKDIKYFNAAKKYYSQGLTLGPKRPQFLYGMFDIYRMEGNVDGSKRIADQILAQWPDDFRTKSALDSFLAKALTLIPK